MVQGRPTSETYESHHSRLVAEKPAHILTSIKPMTEADAREWVGAANKHDAPTNVKEHFVEQVRRLA
jgi:hypothetical protein